jgi:hypothetical protein
MSNIKTRSEQAAADIAALLRARNANLWIVTREEARAERYIFEAAAAANYIARTWDCAAGVTEMDGSQSPIGSNEIDPTLEVIKDRAMRGSERGVWIMRDLPAWLNGPIGINTLRRVRNLARMLPGVPRERAQAMIVISPNGDVPPELAGHTTVVEWPLPDRTEIEAFLDAALESLPEDIRAAAAPNGQRDAAIDAAVGLSGEEAQACYARSLVQLRRIDPKTVGAEKKRVIAREKVLEWFDPLPGGLDAVGGLDGLKGWMLGRTAAYSPRARAYGLPAPKGLLLVGVPGCGKSLFAKAIATMLGWPLLRLDLGALKSKFVGESEANLRKALKVIETVGRCVVWLDEVEKALAGATQGAADGGVSSDALGSILSWMQDRAGEAFVIATANNVDALPPELTRKGRFDEIFFVDLPNESEREAVLAATLRKFNREKIKVDYKRVAEATEKFTGSEIAEIVPSAMFAAFGDNEREITTTDLIEAASTVVPLAKTSAEKIDALRNWAKTRARPASSVQASPAERRKQVRALDIE